jgi:tetratricopeptide (TPR) repeat protein
VKKRIFLIFCLVFLSVSINAVDNTVDTTSSATVILEDIPKLETSNPEKIKPKIETKLDNDGAKNDKPVTVTEVKPDVKVENVKKEEPKTEAIKTEDINKQEDVKKQDEEVKIMTQTIDDIIVLSADHLKENSTFENKHRDTKLIIFENSNEKIPSSLTYEYEEEKTDERQYYETGDFIPKSEKEFYLVHPEFNYTGDMVVSPGKLHIPNDLGENIFKRAFDLFKKGETNSAGLLFEKLVNYNHRIPESLYYAGLCHYLEKNNFAAIDYLKQAVKTGTEAALPSAMISVYYFQIGNIHYEMDDCKKAVENYSHALELNPSNSDVYNGMGLAYYKTGEIDEALDAWKKGKDAGNANCEANFKWLSGKLNK